jgi:hormone-sensitive lipase
LVKKPYEESIRIRINYNKKLQPRNQNAKGSPKNKDTGRNSFFESVTKLFKSEEKAPKAVIFHIHGGGFISMSSFIHQTYTRRWANNLNVPIVSVDYGKAPSRPYPEGLYDCLEAYMWTVNVFTQLF